MLEIYSNKLKKWVLYDVDKKCFKDGNKFMNLNEIIKSNKFKHTPPLTTFFWITLVIKYFLMGEFIKYNTREWYEKVFHFFSIYDLKSKRFIFKTNDSFDKKEF